MSISEEQFLRQLADYTELSVEKVKNLNAVLSEDMEYLKSSAITMPEKAYTRKLSNYGLYARRFKAAFLMAALESSAIPFNGEALSSFIKMQYNAGIVYPLTIQYKKDPRISHLFQSEDVMLLDIGNIRDLLGLLLGNSVIVVPINQEKSQFWSLSRFSVAELNLVPNARRARANDALTYCESLNATLPSYVLLKASLKNEAFRDAVLEAKQAEGSLFLLSNSYSRDSMAYVKPKQHTQAEALGGFRSVPSYVQKTSHIAQQTILYWVARVTDRGEEGFYYNGIRTSAKVFDSLKEVEQAQNEGTEYMRRADHYMSAIQHQRPDIRHHFICAQERVTNIQKFSDLREI